MKRLPIAIIGSGQIARTQHIPAYIASGLADIKYVMDQDESIAQAVATEFGIKHVATTLEEVLLDEEVVAISVCTPNATHAPISIAALRAGKHVLCEKPAAIHYREAWQMKQVADECNRLLAIGVVNRFNTAVNKVKELVSSGELGVLYHVDCSFRAHRSIPGLGRAFTSKELSGGGVLIDWGIHFIDLILYMLGEAVKPLTVSGAVYGELGKRISDYSYVDMWAGPPKLDGVYDVEDFVTAFIRTEGPSIKLTGAWAQNSGQNDMFVELLGSKAGIKLDYDGCFTVYSSSGGILYETKTAFAQENKFEAEIKDFLQSIQSNQKNRANIDHVLMTSRIIDALYESAAIGKEVMI